MIDGLAAAYSATGAAWQDGPGEVYDRLAEAVVAWSPIPVAGAVVLDVGAGTGAVTRAATAAGAARVSAVDVAPGMLAHDAPVRPPAVLADLQRAPFRAASFDLAIAGFSLNHLTDPAAGLHEMARVTRPGGGLLASAYGTRDSHPAKAAVEAALAARGWRPEAWHDALRRAAVPQLATPDGAVSVLRAAALRGDVEAVTVPIPHFGPRQLVAWRLGMAQHAPFVASLAPHELEGVVQEALARLGPEPPPLVRSIVVLRAIRP